MILIHNLKRTKLQNQNISKVQNTNSKYLKLIIAKV